MQITLPVIVDARETEYADLWEACKSGVLLTPIDFPLVFTIVISIIIGVINAIIMWRSKVLGVIQRFRSLAYESSAVMV